MTAEVRVLARLRLQGRRPELYQSMIRVAPELGIELVELYDGNCTGAGVISEHSLETADALNARNFAHGAAPGPAADQHLQHLPGRPEHGAEPDEARTRKLATEVNDDPRRRGPVLRRRNGLEVKNFLWVLVEDFGLDRLKSMVKKPADRPQGRPVLRLLHPAPRARSSASTSTRTATSTSRW